MPGQYELDPQLLRQQMLGLQAQNQLQGLNESGQLARALRMSETQLPDVQGQGLAAQAPTLLNMISTAMTQRQGQNQMRGLDKRAQALRGDVSAGQMAGVQSQDDLRRMVLQRQDAQLAEKNRVAAEQAQREAGQLSGPYQVYEKDGRTFSAAPTKGEGAKDSRMNPVDLNDANKVFPPKSKSGGREGFYKTTPKQQSDFEALSKSFQDMDYAKDSFKDNYANPGGIPAVNTFKLWKAKAAPITASDEDKESAQWWANYQRMYELPLRHDFFGGALTATEAALWKAANITPDMEPEQIKESLRVQEALYRKMGAVVRSRELAKGGTGDYLDRVFPEDVFYVDESVNDEITNSLLKKGILQSRPSESGAQIKNQKLNKLTDPNEYAAKLDAIAKQLQEQEAFLNNAEVSD
jgi:hypothetical protein